MDSSEPLAKRKYLNHDVPGWVPSGSVYFITINTKPRGSRILLDDQWTPLFLDSLSHRIKSKTWYLHLWLNMPDHIHALMSFGAQSSMKKVIAEWKRYMTCHSTIRWQQGFFDHRIRDEKSYIEKYQYIIQNPVRAGLVNEPDDWKYCWRAKDFEG